MLELCGNPNLAEEPIRTDVRGQFRAQDLDGYIAIVPQIVRKKHEGHAALAEFAVNGIPPGEGFGQAFRGRRHGGKDGVGIRCLLG